MRRWTQAAGIAAALTTVAAADAAAGEDRDHVPPDGWAKSICSAVTPGPRRCSACRPRRAGASAPSPNAGAVQDRAGAPVRRAWSWPPTPRCAGCGVPAYPRCGTVHAHRGAVRPARWWWRATASGSGCRRSSGCPPSTRTRSTTASSRRGRDDEPRTSGGGQAFATSPRRSSTRHSTRSPSAADPHVPHGDSPAPSGRVGTRVCRTGHARGR